MQPPDLPDATGPTSGPLDATILEATKVSGAAAATPVNRAAAEPLTADDDQPRLGRVRQPGDEPAAMTRRSRAGELTLTEPDEDAQDRRPRQLHPLPPGLVELYGLLAVLFVLVPEWMAGGALFGFREGRRGSELPAPSGAWKRLPELRLASLNLAELRQLSREQGLLGYSRQSRQELTGRLLRRLRARP